MKTESIVSTKKREHKCKTELAHKEAWVVSILLQEFPICEYIYTSLTKKGNAQDHPEWYHCRD